MLTCKRPGFPREGPALPPPTPARLGADVICAHEAEPLPGESRAAASGSDASSAEIPPPPSPPGIFQAFGQPFFLIYPGRRDLRRPRHSPPPLSGYGLAPPPPPPPADKGTAPWNPSPKCDLEICRSREALWPGWGGGGRKVKGVDAPGDRAPPRVLSLGRVGDGLLFWWQWRNRPVEQCPG